MNNSDFGESTRCGLFVSLGADYGFRVALELHIPGLSLLLWSGFLHYSKTQLPDRGRDFQVLEDMG